MSGFIRRFTFDPGIEEITAIEGVIIIDREPPATITGLGNSTVLCVGEFENGPFEVPTEVTSSTDLLDTFGGLGFTYDGVPSSNPCCRARKADSAIKNEFWNGNGFIALVNKRFRRLILVRVDTSVGSVEFTRLASLAGNGNFNWDLEPAQTVVLTLADSDPVTATFNATATLVNSAAGSYPTTFAGGEKMNVTIDEGQPSQIGPIDIVFQDADELQTDVINRINAVLGYTAATNQGGSVTRITGRVRGTGGNVKINSVDAAVTTKTGFSATSSVGTGNVSNIDQVSLLEAKAVIEAAAAGTVVDRDFNGKIRISATSAVALRFRSTSTAVAFGFTNDQVSTQPDGFAMLTTSSGTYPNGFAGGETLTLGFDGDPNVVVTFQAGDTTKANVITRINLAFASIPGFVPATDAGGNKIRLTSRVNGGQVRVVAASAGTVLTNLGLAVVTVQAVANVDSTIPAGSRVRNTGGVEFVTMQDVSVRASGADPATAVAASGPYSAKVRHALDDGTGLSTVAASVTSVPFAIPGSAWKVTNANPLSAALTEAQIDAKYVTAIDSTLDPSAVSRDANFIFSARQSNVVRQQERSNAVDASANGLRGRFACIRPPLGTTTRAQAKSSIAQPGVGAYRHDRVIYCFPGASTFVPQIAARGTMGGTGFTADGNVDVGFDSWVASCASQLPPEENPGQSTDFMLLVQGLEKGNPDVQKMSMTDYVLFRKSGIAALRIDGGKAIIQSGVTAVDPAVQPNLVNIARRRMADFIQDTIAVRLKSFTKKLNTRLRRALAYGEVDAFMTTLLGGDNPAANQRIDSYSLDAKTPNTKTTLAAGIFRMLLKVRTLSSMDFIVLETVIGESVEPEVNELAQAA